MLLRWFEIKVYQFVGAFHLRCTPYHLHGSGSLKRAGPTTDLRFLMSSTSGKDQDPIDWKYPYWDGDWLTFQDYALRVELKADATKPEELEQLGPRLAGNLVGKAFESIVDISRPDLKTKTGWKFLLQHLEKKRGKEKVDILGDSFTDFFIRKDAQRRDGEELSDYALRFTSLVRKLDRALKESGAEGKIPQELYGWFLRMVPLECVHENGSV